MKRFYSVLTFCTVFVLIGFAHHAFANTFTLNSSNFKELRYDHLIPEYCHNPRLDNFDSIEDWPVYGIDGSLRKGFDYEYDLARSDARWLWDAFRRGGNPRSWPRRLDKEVQIIKEYKDEMGFEFGNEGEVLEILALVDLQEEYDPEEYFFTGGVQYRNEEGRIVGELDVLVGERETCNFIVVGEAKLGNGSLRKAKSQLRRFANYLDERGYNSHYRNNSEQVAGFGQNLFFELLPSF